MTIKRIMCLPRNVAVLIREVTEQQRDRQKKAEPATLPSDGFQCKIRSFMKAEPFTGIAFYAILYMK